MKRIFSMLMAITMLACAVGFVPINAQASEWKYDDLNEFEIGYNVSYYQFEGSGNKEYRKIQSVDELPYASGKYAGYDEDFFNDKFLIVLDVGVAAYSGDSFRVVSVTEDEKNLVIDVDYVATEIGLEDWIPWKIMLEADRTQLDKEITVREGHICDADYYIGGIGLNSETLDPQSAPYIVKINSAEQLESYVGNDKDEIIKQSKTWFSLDAYILFIQWVEPAAVRTRGVKSIYYNLYNDNGQIIVKMQSFTPDGEYPTVVTPYCAVMPISNEFMDNEIVLEYDDDKTLEISTAEALKAFADDVNKGNTYKGKTVTLTADIDLSTICGADINGEEVSWTPIGYDYPFYGAFDGAGHTVSGLYINSGYLDYAGLFGYCGKSSQILNLVVDGSVKVGYPSLGDEWAAAPPIDIGGIVGISEGKIANCHNKAAITGLGNGAYAAGICGRGASVIENCINTGVIVSEYKSEAIMALGSSHSNNNCYYLEGASVDGSGAQAKTADQFASGEVAYLLGDAWGQKIGVDKYPVIGGDRVYITDNGYTNAPSSKRVVTIEPPTVNIESGEVPYGSKITISPTNGNDFMYSVNGERFINSRLTNTWGNAAITITENTVLVVRSMIDVIEPDVEYVFPEATYNYTIGGCVFPAEYPYIINSIKLVSESGEEYDTPPADKSFIIDVDITEILERDVKDYFIVAVYDTDGALVSMNYIKANLSAGASFSCGVNIPETDKTIGSIKAFVWDSPGGMSPLAKTVCIEL